MIGTRSAISIRARGQRPHLEAVYMTAPRSFAETPKKPLPIGGRPYMTEEAHALFSDRRLKRQRGVPRKMNPGVLRDFGDEGVDQRPSLRLGVDGGEMRVRNQLAHQPPGLAGIDEVIDDQESLAGALAELGDIRRDALEHFQVALLGVIVTCDADGIDDANAKFARDDGRRHQTAA